MWQYSVPGDLRDDRNYEDKLSGFFGGGEDENLLRRRQENGRVAIGVRVPGF